MVSPFLHHLPDHPALSASVSDSVKSSFDNDIAAPSSNDGFQHGLHDDKSHDMPVYADNSPYNNYVSAQGYGPN